jgi:thiol-disulfide isomerase/thioredoxin
MSRTGRQIINTKQSAPLARRRNILAGASLAILAIVVIIAIALANRVPPAATVAANSTQAVKVGQVAPDFTLSTTAGPFELSKAAGKPTLLEVFATWCPHCQREVQVLDPLYATYKNKVNFVAVNGAPLGMDQQPETQADVVAFAQKFGVTYPIAFDPNLDVAHIYLQSGYPTVVLIGANGKIAALRDGEIPAADLKNALDAAIAGKSPDPKMGFKGA